MNFMITPTTIPPPVSQAMLPVLWPQHLLTEYCPFTRPLPAAAVRSLLEDLFAQAPYPHDGINE